MKARDNPFSAERLHGARYRLRKGTWDALMEKLRKLHYRCAIIGPHGSGKTALLDELGRRLEKGGFSVKRLFLSRECRRFEEGFLDGFFKEPGGNDIVLFDGADIMGRRDWRNFRQRSSRAAGVIVTSHRARLFPVLMKCSTTLELLEEIVEELLGRRDPALGVTIRTLFNKYHGDLRGALRELYDIFSSHDDFRNIS